VWVAGERSVSKAAKSRKDVRQATQLLEVLAEDRPHDITAAFDALGNRRSMLRAVKARLKSLEPELRGRIDLLIHDAASRAKQGLAECSHGWMLTVHPRAPRDSTAIGPRRGIERPNPLVLRPGRRPLLVETL
jgi:hypothetical protein